MSNCQQWCYTFISSVAYISQFMQTIFLSLCKLYFSVLHNPLSTRLTRVLSSCQRQWWLWAPSFTCSKHRWLPGPPPTLHWIHWVHSTLNTLYTVYSAQDRVGIYPVYNVATYIGLCTLQFIAQHAPYTTLHNAH